MKNLIYVILINYLLHKKLFDMKDKICLPLKYQLILSQDYNLLKLKINNFNFHRVVNNTYDSSR